LATAAQREAEPRSLVHPRLYANALERFPSTKTVRMAELLRFLAKFASARARRIVGRASPPYNRA
jgi:hypothetical protein